jgi:ubiquinone/menaquinone biosynthesis C-methylase UbiE
MKLEREGTAYKAKKKYRDVRIAERYDQTRFTGALGRIKLKRDQALVSRALRTMDPIGCVLDLPCGTGRFTPVLQERAGRVVSADISREMMAVAASRFPSAKVGFIQCSVEALPFQDSCFDLTFTARFLLHLPLDLRQAAFRELSRVSKRWVFFDCLMEAGPKGWLRRLLAPMQKGRKPKKRLKKEELSRILDQTGLRVHRIYRPSWFFSEKWMVLCEKVNRR